MQENKSLSVPSPEEPPIRHRRKPEPLVGGSHVMQFTSNKSGVLLQVVLVPPYGPFSRLNVRVLLNSGSTCSLIKGELADQLNLDGPTTSLDLFGIQIISYLFTNLFI